jgi:hypothetical protein
MSVKQQGRHDKTRKRRTVSKTTHQKELSLITIRTSIKSPSPCLIRKTNNAPAARSAKNLDDHRETIRASETPKAKPPREKPAKFGRSAQSRDAIAGPCRPRLRPASGSTSLSDTVNNAQKPIKWPALSGLRGLGALSTEAQPSEIQRLFHYTRVVAVLTALFSFNRSFANDGNLSSVFVLFVCCRSSVSQSGVSQPSWIRYCDWTLVARFPLFLDPLSH